MTVKQITSIRFKINKSLRNEVCKHVNKITFKSALSQAQPKQWGVVEAGRVGNRILWAMQEVFFLIIKGYFKINIYLVINPPF